jgi:hypothetical protein
VPNTRDLCKRLVRLGGTVEKLPGTGEIVCTHPTSRKKVRVQHWTRRKSAPKALVVLVRRAEES